MQLCTSPEVCISAYIRTPAYTHKHTHTHIFVDMWKCLFMVVLGKDTPSRGFPPAAPPSRKVLWSYELFKESVVGLYC